MNINAKFREIAASREHHPQFEIPTMDLAVAMIEEHGYKMRRKRPEAFASTMTTTDVATKTVWLATTWSKKTEDRKGQTLYHECVHIIQAKDWGNLLFAARYAVPRWRWAIEMQAYAVSVLVARALGSDISPMPAAIAKTMAEKYGPWVIGKKEVEEETVKFLQKV